MKNSLFPRLVASLLIVGSFASCDNSMEDFSQDNLEPIQGQEIRINPEFQFLEFGSDQVFRDTYQNLYENQLQLEEFENSFDGFTSQVKAFDMIDSEEEYELIAENIYTHPFRRFLQIVKEPNTKELEAERIIQSPIYARMINQDGLLRIADAVYKFIPQRVLIAKTPSKAQIQEMMDWDGTTTPEYARVQVSETSDSQQSLSKSLLAQCTDNYRIGRNDFRVVGKQKYSKTSISSDTWEHIIITKHQRKRLGIWWSNDDAVLGLSFQGAFTIGGILPEIDASQTFPDEATDRIEEVIAVCTPPANTPNACDFGLVWTFGPTADHAANQGNAGDDCQTTL